MAYERLRLNLEKLKLNTVAEILDSSLERAAKEDKTVLEVLDHLLEEERRASDGRGHSGEDELRGLSDEEDPRGLRPRVSALPG